MPSLAFYIAVFHVVLLKTIAVLSSFAEEPIVLRMYAFAEEDDSLLLLLTALSISRIFNIISCINNELTRNRATKSTGIVKRSVTGLPLVFAARICYIDF